MTFLSRRFFPIRGVHLFRRVVETIRPLIALRPHHIHAQFPIPFPSCVHIHASNRFYLQIAGGDGAILRSSLLFSFYIFFAQKSPRRESEMLTLFSLIRLACAASNEGIDPFCYRHRVIRKTHLGYTYCQDFQLNYVMTDKECNLNHFYFYAVQHHIIGIASWFEVQKEWHRDTLKRKRVQLYVKIEKQTCKIRS